MNEDKIINEWKNFEDGFGAYMFDVRKMGTTIQFDKDSPNLMKSLLRKSASEAMTDIDKCILAIKHILNEI